MRADGKRAKEPSAIMTATPYIMPHRYDAQNMITEHVDLDILRKYVHEKRRVGVRISYMSLVLTAYYKSCLKNPKLNRFIVNKKIYDRNHFCVSFVILKTRADGTPDEATLKVYFEPEDDIISINRKIEQTIEENRNETFENATDKFANFVFSIPLLPSIVVGLARLMDRWGILPRSIIDLSPFHTSVFITNLASINTSTIYHHCYDFGTTSVFICMGKPIPDYISGNYKKHLLPLSCVMDERICTGSEFAAFWASFQSYMRHPETLENQPEQAEEQEEETAAAGV